MPLDPDLIEIHPAFEEAVHAHRDEVLTSMSPLRDRELTVRKTGSMEYEQVGAGGGAGGGAGDGGGAGGGAGVGEGDGDGPGLGAGAGGGGGVAAGRSCSTVNVSPAIESPAVRSTPVFRSTLSVTVPWPVPLGVITCTHDTGLDAVQPHPLRTETPTVTVPPAAPTRCALVLS